MMPLTEILTPYAEAKRNTLYLPPIDDYEVILQVLGNGEIFRPAGYKGPGKIKYVPQPDDFTKSYAYKRKLTPPSFVPGGEPIERDRGVSYYSNSKPNSLIGNSSRKENSSRNETEGGSQ
jgi:hypothetical protein